MLKTLFNNRKTATKSKLIEKHSVSNTRQKFLGDWHDTCIALTTTV